MGKEQRMKTGKRTLIHFNPAFGFVYLLVSLSSMILLASRYYLAAFLPVVAMVVFFILAWKPDYGLLLIIFLIPLDAYTGLTEGYSYLTITKFIGFWLIIVVSFYFLLRKGKIELFIFKTGIWKWLWLFLLINFISALMSDYYATSFYGIRRLIAAYIFFALTLVLVSYKDFVKRIPALIIASNAIGSFLAVTGYIFHLKYFATGLGESKYALERATGLSAGPNFLAMMIVFSFPFIVHMFLSSKQLRKKILAFILVVANMMSLILTYSRSGALVLLIILIILIFMYRRYFRPRNWGFVMIIFTSILIAMIIFSPASYKKRIRSFTQARTDTSILGRLSYIDVAWQSVIKHPFFGTGPATFPEIYAHSKTPYKYLYKDYKRVAHNVYIEILVGTGFFGLVPFLILLLFSIKSLYKARKVLIKKGYNRLIPLFNAYLLSFFAMLIFFSMLSRMFNKYFWMMIAIAQLSVFLVEKVEEMKRADEEAILLVYYSSTK